ncbi:hypothetical protein GCM10022215_01120 [Nocardioides fonticola]|uniref:Septum formation-related domain-containing protein n=1 Tax=Nocardioides fonticola TaxID=450363 RepID=A0ABP7X958_9ACTN
MAAPRRRAKPRRQPAVLAVVAVLALVAVILVVVTRVGGSDRPAGSSDSAAGPGTSASDASTPSASPTPPPRPRRAQCRELSYQAALATSDDSTPISCALPHTAMTIAVEALPRDTAGTLLPTTTVRSRARVAATCRREAAAFLGGTAEERELSMLQVVWFVPTPAQIEAGADWFRCDLIALRAEARLLPLTGRLRDVIAGDGAARYAMCGTAAPGTTGFSRVVCSGPHRWRAISIVPLADAAGAQGRYPGQDVVRERGQEPCQNAGQDAADDPLDFQWGYEWPTAEQWSAGQTYGICWIPA